MKSNIIKVHKNILLSLIDYCYEEDDFVKNELKNYELVETKLVSRSSWYGIHNLIFKFNGKYYAAPNYELGLTECQDSPLYEFEADFIECKEVEKCEVIAYEYKPITSGYETA